jgi:hypothetical protein
METVEWDQFHPNPHSVSKIRSFFESFLNVWNFSPLTAVFVTELVSIDGGHDEL